MINDNIRHAELIANVIARLNGNAFAAKGWCVLIAASLFAFAASTKNPWFSLIAVFAAASLWTVDAYYLSRERRFRELFAEVAQAIAPTDWSMDVSRLNSGNLTWFSSLWSGSMLIYLCVGVTAALVAAVLASLP